MFGLRHLFVTIILILAPTAALACGSNEYEQCWSVDLGPLGTAKDCKCLPKIGGAVGQAGEAIKPTIAQIATELQKTPEAIQACVHDVEKCAIEILSAPLALQVKAYIEALYQQAQGRVQSFSPEFVALAQPYYDVNISQITYANDINTLHGMTVSYCDRIFFAGHGNLWTDKSELNLVLHELEHAVQCQKRGKSAYLAEYVLKGISEVVKNGRFNIHDLHDYEVAANNKANAITDEIWNKIQSGSVPTPTGGQQTSAKFPPGSVVQACGCWGFVAGTVSAPLCQSGAANPQACFNIGMCMGGSLPYGLVCQ